MLFVLKLKELKVFLNYKKRKRKKKILIPKMIEKDGSNFGLSLNNTISQAYKQKRVPMFQCFGQSYLWEHFSHPIIQRLVT